MRQVGNINTKLQNQGVELKRNQCSSRPWIEATQDKGIGKRVPLKQILQLEKSE